MFKINKNFPQLLIKFLGILIFALLVIINTSHVPVKAAVKRKKIKVFDKKIISPSDSEDLKSKIAKGDFNKDGYIDIVSGSSRIFINNHNGTFTVQALPGEPFNGFDVVTGDFNNDSNLDIVSQTYAVSHQWRYWQGNGDGSFSQPQIYTNSSAVVGLDAGDLNNDGNLDLIFSSHTNCEVYYYIGKGDGAFEPPITLYGGSAFPWSCSGGYEVVIEDFNKDSNQDLLVVYENYGNFFEENFSGMISYLEGKGNGQFKEFQPLVFTGECTAPQSVKPADFDNDGHLDIIVANSGANLSCGKNANGGIVFYKGQGDGTIDENSKIQITDKLGSHSLDASDFNNDGSLDLVVTVPWNQFVPNQTRSGALYLEGYGNGKFKIKMSSSVDTCGLSIDDFNNDGADDFILVGKYPNKNADKIHLVLYPGISASNFYSK